MHSKVRVRLFGAAGERTTEVSTRGGFPTRHIKAQCETGPSRKPRDHDHRDGALPPTFESVPETKTDEKHATSILDILKQMHSSVDS